MRRLAALALVLAACEKDEATTPIAAQIRRLEKPAERLDALEKIEKILVWSVRDVPSARDAGQAVAPVLALAEEGEEEVRLHAISTLSAIGGRLVDALRAGEPGEAGAQIASILRALTAVLASRDAERLRERAAMRLGSLVGRIDEEPKAAALAAVGDAADAAFAALLRAGSDESDGVRGESLAALGSTGRKEAVPIVTKGLREPWKRVNCSSGAAGALKNIGEKHAEARVALIEVAADESLPEDRRREAASMLGLLGTYGHLGAERERAVAVLRMCLVAHKAGGGRASLRGAAAHALGEIRDADEATALALVAATEDEDYHVRGDVVQALGKIGSGDRRVVESLAARLEDEERLVQQAAAKALVALGPKAEPALPSLLRIARAMNPFLRESAAEAFGRIGRADENVIAALIGAARDTEPSVRMAAVVAIGALAPRDPEVVAVLNHATADAEELVRNNAARALASCGRRSDAALDDAIRILGGADRGLSLVVAVALAELGPRAAPAVPELAAALAIEDEWLRRAAISALVAIGEGAEPAIPALRKVAEADPKLAFEVGGALWHIAGDPSVLLPLSAREMAAAAGKDTYVFARMPLAALVRDLQSEPPPPPQGFGDSRLGSGWEIGRRGPEAAEAAGALAALVRDGSRDLALTAAAALSRIGKAAVPSLVDLLAAEGADARTLAATALGEIGPDASAALPRLREVAKGAEPRARRAAEAAIARIGK